MQSRSKRKRQDSDSENDNSDDEDQRDVFCDEEDTTNKTKEKFERLEKQIKRLERKGTSQSSDDDDDVIYSFQTFGTKKDEKWSPDRNEASLKRNKTNFYHYHEPNTNSLSTGDCYGCLMISSSTSRSTSSDKKSKTVYSLSSVIYYLLGEIVEEEASQRTKEIVKEEEEVEIEGQSTKNAHFCRNCLTRYYSAIEQYVSCQNRSFEYASYNKYKEFETKEKTPLLQLCNSDEYLVNRIDNVLEDIRKENEKRILRHTSTVDKGLQVKHDDGKEEVSDVKQSMSYRNGIYIGDVRIKTKWNVDGEKTSEKSQPHGDHGSFHQTYGKGKISYTGKWKDGHYDGSGVLCSGDTIYDGQFKQGKRHDDTNLATLTVLGVKTFLGNFKNDLRHGVGTSYSLDQKRQTSGEYVNGQKKGTFTTTHEDMQDLTIEKKYCAGIEDTMGSIITNPQKSQTYTGAIRGFRPHGKGIMEDTSSGTTTFEGEWYHGKKNGKGKMEDENNIYIGNWSEDQRNGQFCLISKQSGVKKEVVFENDLILDLEKRFLHEVTLLRFEKHGSFDRTVPKTSKGFYTGECKITSADEYTAITYTPHGKGTWESFGNGRYTGEWREGLMHGKGTFLVNSCTLGANVSEYTGDFNVGKMQGIGTFTYMNGSVFKGSVVDNSPSEGRISYPLCSSHPLNEKLEREYSDNLRKLVDRKYNAILSEFSRKVEQGYKKEFDETRARLRAEKERDPSDPSDPSHPSHPPRVSHYIGSFSFHKFHGYGILYDSCGNTIEEGYYYYGKLGSTTEDDASENYCF